jgi:3-hydroxybutyryl-CoA dehydrogenase
LTRFREGALAPLFRKSEQKVAQEAAVQAEIERLKTFSVQELSMAVLPGLGPDGAGTGRTARPQQLCEYLLRDFPGAGHTKPLQLMARVRRALDLLEEAGLASSMSYERSPVWRITDLGETMLTEGTIEQRVSEPGVSRAAGLPAEPAGVLGEVRRVAVVGAGTMGQQIGFQCAGHRIDVVLYDVAPAALESAQARIAAYSQGLVARGVITAELRDAALARITTTTDPSVAAAEADLLSEAVPEDPKLKGRVLAEFDALCPPRTIFATNTSTLLPSQFAQATGRPDHVIALHFHLPVWVANLADVMPHEGTAREVTELVLRFARQIGQVPIELRREHNGYVFNAMYSAVNREAITMAEQGVAPIEDIDRAWMLVTKWPHGPFGGLDAIGIDAAWQITDYWARELPADLQLRRNADFLKGYIDRGELGVKSGKGFYSYAKPAFERPGFTEGA